VEPSQSTVRTKSVSIRQLYWTFPSVNCPGTYAKLEARDRSAAVERAREPRLISSGSLAH
jgi:hypothetical protein